MESELVLKHILNNWLEEEDSCVFLPAELLLGQQVKDG